VLIADVRIAVAGRYAAECNMITNKQTAVAGTVVDGGCLARHYVYPQGPVDSRPSDFRVALLVHNKPEILFNGPYAYVHKTRRTAYKNPPRER
jgi:hypothetical protein